jgi:hypothetical protein
MADYGDAQVADPRVRNGLVRCRRPGPTSRLLLELPPKKVTQAAIGAGMARVEKPQAVKMITPGSGVISITGFHITSFISRSRDHQPGAEYFPRLSIATGRKTEEAQSPSAKEEAIRLSTRRVSARDHEYAPNQAVGA